VQSGNPIFIEAIVPGGMTARLRRAKCGREDGWIS
jgi:hypothetical protein